MKTNIIRSVALMLTVCGGGFAQAQYGQYNYAVQPSAVAVHPSLQQPQAQNPQPQAQYAVQPQAQYAQPQTQYAQPQAQHAAQPQAQYARPQTQSTQPPAQPGYTYQPGSPYRTVGQSTGGYEVIGQPTPAVQPLPAQQHQPMIGAGPAPMGQPVAQPVSNPGCSTCNQQSAPAASYGYEYNQSNVYVQAAEAPIGGGDCGCAPAPACSVPVCCPPPTRIRPCFGGLNILFLDRSENYDRALVFDDVAPATTRLRAADADQDFAMGYDVTFGRYIGCGQFAISATWLHIDNGSDSASVTPAAAGDYRANFRNFDRIYYDRTGDNTHTDWNVPATDESFYAYMDRAESFSVRRSANYYGLELNLTGFGIGGAARAGRPNCGGGCGPACGANQCGGCNDCNPCCPPPRGCGGQCGPMIPACCSKLQMSWTTGLRWFHFEDSFGFAARSERFPAAPAIMDNFRYDVDAENELFGWQVGGKMSYCCGCRTSIYGGLKAGIFANDASLYSRVYSDGQAGRVSDLGHSYPTYANQDVTLRRSDTVLASLAEIDLGIGYRLCDCWTVRGGYRYLAVSGVATAIDNINDNPANFASANVWANDSLLLHGGYVGLDYNW